MTGIIDSDEILCTLLHGLKAKGYSIGTDAFIKSTQLLQWFLKEKRGSDLASFASYLAPVICKSAEEQVGFKKLFDELFLGPFAEFKKHILIEEEKKKEAEAEAKRLRNLKWRRIFLPAAVIFMASVAGIWYYNQPDKSPVLKDDFRFDQPFYVNRNNPVSISHAGIFEDPADSSKFEAEYTFQRSGKTRKGVSVTHSFDQYGIDTFSFILKAKAFGIEKSIINPEVYVGPEHKLTISPEKEILTSGEENTYTANIDTTIGKKFYWEVATSGDNDKKRDTSTSNPLKYRFTDTGEYRISVKYDTQKDSFLDKFPADFISASYLQKVIPPGLQLVTDNRIPPQPLFSFSVSKIWASALAVLALLLLYAAFRIFRQKTWPAKYQEDNFNGDKPPYDLQFVSKEQNITVDYSLLRLANDLKKRVESRTSSFDIPKTISQSILNRGFITPGFSHKQTHREYLFLIDHAYTNSQQMKLFGYLARYFIKYQVKLDFFFYHQTPDKFYKEVDGPRMTLENIKDRYYNSALILFADGASFIDYKTSKLNEKISGGFAYWTNRVLITPVPFNDWTNNEKVLSSFFNVLPADLIGLLELVRAIDTDTSEKLFLGQFYSYDAKYIEFGSIEALREYLGDEELFQWVAALAIHPKIYWEITLEIGKTIVSQQSKINYDTLLKLARIRWIAEGTFLPSTRLELLKRLTRENEIKARESVLKMLDELPADEGVFSFEEKQVSQYTNSFALFSTGREKYTSDKKIQEGEEKFLALYENNKVFDNPFKIYIEKKETANDRWETTLTTSEGNAGIDTYIREKRAGARNTARKERLKRNRIMSAFAGGAAALLLLLGYLIFDKNAIANSNINQYLHLADTNEGVDNTTRLNFYTRDCFQQLLRESKDTFATLEVSVGTSVLSTNKIRFSDSILVGMNYRGLSYDSTESMQYTLSFNSGRSFRDSIPLLPGTYDIRLAGCTLPTTVDTVYYRVGINEDTTAIVKAIKELGYVIIYPNWSNLSGRKPITNVILFGKNMSAIEKFDFGNRLLQAGFPLKSFGIDMSETRNVELRGEEGADYIKVMSSDTLKCLLGLGGCKSSEKSLVQILSGTSTPRSKVTQLRACINNRSVFNVETKGLATGSPRNQVWYFRDSYRDTVNLLLACLKTYFPDKTFTVLKKKAPLNSTVSAQIFVFDTVIFLPTKTAYIRFSDETMRGDAERLGNELAKTGISVPPPQLVRNITANVIEYQYSTREGDANEAKRIYERLFPNTSISLRYTPNQPTQPDLVISIIKSQPPVEKLYIRNVKYSRTISVGEKLSVSFDIGFDRTGGAVSRNEFEGRICLSGQANVQAQMPANSCESFSFNNVSETSILKESDSRSTPGQYELRVIINNLKIDTVLGYVTIEPVRAPPAICDTIHSYIGKGKDNIFFNGKTYINRSLNERGIELSLIGRDPKVATFTIEKGKCPVQKLTFYLGETKTIDFCDGTQIRLRMLNWENKTGNPKNPEAIFDAFICKPVQSNK